MFVSPIASPAMQEIAAHLTPTEKREFKWVGGMFGIWNAATWFAPVWVMFFMAKPLNDWRIALGAWAVGILFFPAWYRMIWKMSCSTEWARAQGINPKTVRLFSFAPRNLWKMAAFARRNNPRLGWG